VNFGETPRAFDNPERELVTKMITHIVSRDKFVPGLESLARAKSYQIAAPEAEGRRDREALAGICASLARGQGVGFWREGRGCPLKAKIITKVTVTPSPVTTSYSSCGGASW
jgi:hypothetical protein